ncbi:MAG: hypothetical protein ACTSPI_01265 [Candidatus Heimdallarchaeaceae archaeon]
MKRDSKLAQEYRFGGKRTKTVKSQKTTKEEKEWKKFLKKRGLKEKPKGKVVGENNYFLGEGLGIKYR